MRHWPKFGQPTKWKLYMQIVVVLAQRWYDVVEPTKQKHVFQCISFCLPNVSPIQQSLSYSSCWCAHCAPNANCQTVNCSTIDQTGLYKTESTVEPKGGSRTVWKICWLCFCKCWLHNTHIYTLIVVMMQCLHYVFSNYKSIWYMWKNENNPQTPIILPRRDHAHGFEIPGSATGTNQVKNHRVKRYMLLMLHLRITFDNFADIFLICLN